MTDNSVQTGLKPRCRHCDSLLDLIFADLGATPVSNDFLSHETRWSAESYFPLRAFVCGSCRLVQLEDFHRSTEIFRDDYAYFSSHSSTWLAHARNFCDGVSIELGLGRNSTIVEIASNDGYLLQYFMAKGFRVLGVEPSRSVAEFAIKQKRIPTEIRFFGVETAKTLVEKGFSADLTVANNVLAHVPDINDFVSGFRFLLKPEGVATFEFPHLLNLIRLNQFDTIYHEHFSYFSLIAVQGILGSNGLRVFRVEKLPTHGGSLRVYACREDASHPRDARVDSLLHEEMEAGLNRDELYLSFAEQVRETKRSLLELLISLKRQGSRIVGYGAPAKGNTLLNYCGIGADFLDFTVDLSPQKQGRFLPGSRLEIRAPAAIRDAKPDYILILPWNLKDEIMQQMEFVREWGARFIVPIPRAEIL